VGTGLLRLVFVIAIGNVAGAAWLGITVFRKSRLLGPGSTRSIGRIVIAILVIVGLLSASSAIVSFVALGGTVWAGEWISSWGLLITSAATFIVLAGSGVLITEVLRNLTSAERAMKVVLGTIHPQLKTTHDLGLTAREHEVLATMASGRTSDGELAAILFISEATAATHVRNIMRKTGLNDRRQLVIAGLLDGESQVLGVFPSE